MVPLAVYLEKQNFKKLKMPKVPQIIDFSDILPNIEVYFFYQADSESASKITYKNYVFTFKM